jgi:DNA-binding response OmpR family regulator
MTAPGESGPHADEIPLVLLVEDHEDTRDLYTTGLTAAGFAVDQAASAEHALERLLDRRPDVLVTDLSLPGMSGAALGRHIRRVDTGKPLTLIAVTGRPTREEIAETTAAGFDAVLAKPCLPEELARTIRELLGRGRSLREHSNRIRKAAAGTAERSNRLFLQTRVFLLAAGTPDVVIPCPACEQPLVWRESNRVHDVRYDYFEKCATGCGEYYFDHLRRRMLKLRD